MSLLSQGSRPVTVPSDLKIELTELEDKIFTLFDQCTSHLKTTEGIETSCRIAGGWVRDKLLGLQSNDIDIALSSMMGVSYAERFAEFAKSKGIETGTIAAVKINPDQSKHLETAKFGLFGLELDLVNLRSEEYADSSRIPTEVAFGTPLQDALRRDITINSLFYNIHTREVEDQTGMGLDDLRNGVVRTPLPPRQTFLDDPLRIVRCFRFASRFGFAIVPELSEVVKDPEIRVALIQKVTRERVGEELFKMIKGRDPVHAIRLIYEHSLFEAVFGIFPPDISSKLSSKPKASELSLGAVAILHALLDPSSFPTISLPSLHPSLLQAVQHDPTTKARLYLGAALTPYRDVTYTDKKKKTISGVEIAIRESLKIGTQSHLVDGVPALFAAHKLIGIPQLEEERLTKPSQRVALGLLLREKVVHNANTGSHWSSSILFSLLQELVPLFNVKEDKFHAAEAGKVIDIFNTFVARIEELDLPAAVEAKPLLDGREVVKVLEAPKPGQWTGKVLAEVMEWQLDNPQGTKDQCASWLKGRHDAGEVDIGASEPVTKRARTS